MSDLVIKTNNVPRDTLRWYELTAKEQAEFDYINTEDKQDEAEFVRYRGVVYDLHDMERGFGMSEMPAPFKDWDNYLSDSYFSGVLVRYVHEGDSGDYRVIMGTYMS